MGEADYREWDWVRERDGRRELGPDWVGAWRGRGAGGDGVAWGAAWGEAAVMWGGVGVGRRWRGAALAR
ncbi:MAG: hypothetical protein QF615_03870 [Planctomycetota bacterium]|nr:hypothetical protein [Planctomycetota bacterium]